MTFSAFRKRGRQTFTVIATAFTLFVAGASLRGQSSLATAEGFVRTAYGELLDPSLSVGITLNTLAPGNPPDWSRLNAVNVRLERGPLKPITSADDRSTQLLSVGFLIDIFGDISEVRAHGAYVRDRERAEMVAFATQHQEWSDSALLDELKRRGARFAGSRIEFADGAQLGRLEPLLGRVIMDDIDFLGRYPSGRPDIPDSFQFVWRVGFERQPSPYAGMTKQYMATFEPFDGRVIGVWYRLRSAR